MTDELEDWQLALLVEARRYDDPVIVEAAEAADLQDAQALLNQAQDVDNPVVVEHAEKQRYAEASDLLEAAQGIDDWEVVDAEARKEEREACEVVEEFLSDALKRQHDLRDDVVERMDAPGMVAQFRDEDDGGIELESLSQQPETGGADEDEIDDSPDDTTDPLEDVSADDRKTAKELCERADLFADRTPKHAESLRQQAADLLGVDEFAEIDMEAL